MLRNKKGVTTIAASVVVMYIWAALAMTLTTVSQLPSVKTSFRERKAIERCKAVEQFTVDCESSVAGMSKAEVLDYIRDDDMSTGNKGKL